MNEMNEHIYYKIFVKYFKIHVIHLLIFSNGNIINNFITQDDIQCYQQFYQTKWVFIQVINIQRVLRLFSHNYKMYEYHCILAFKKIKSVIVIFCERMQWHSDISNVSKKCLSKYFRSHQNEQDGLTQTCCATFSTLIEQIDQGQSGQ